MSKHKEVQNHFIVIKEIVDLVYFCSAKWSKLAKSMETETAKMMWTRVQDFGLHYDIQIGDKNIITRKNF